MKILLDPILTAAPSGCSTNIQIVTFVRYILEERGRTDVFFYWRVPTWVTDEEMLWYPQHPNIRYVRFDQHTNDRVQEYLRFSDEMERDVDFFGDLWDFDVLITVRTPLVPLMKLHMMSPRHRDMTYVREVWLIEEMPMFDFKGTVPVMDPFVQDSMVLQGYIAADRVFIMSYHEKKGILEAARRFLSPAMQKLVNDKLVPVIPVQFKEFRLKKPEFFKPYDQKPFCVAFVGRMEKGQAQLDEVNELMIKNWIRKGDKFRMLACTVSRVIKSFDEELIECERFPREKFWQVMQDDVHVVLTLGQEMGFSLSLLEPMILGVPAIVLKRDYALPLLGEDYPFYVQTVTEAYGMVEHFYRNYPSCYARYAQWHKQVFRPMYESRFESDLLYPLLEKAVDDYKSRVREQFQTKKAAKAKNEIVQLIAKHVGDKSEFKILEVIKELGEKKELESLAKKLKPEFIETSSLPWLPTWNEFRLVFKHLFDWQDASIEVGHLKRYS